MASYVEKIKVGTGEAWTIRDAEARELIDAIDEEFKARDSEVRNLINAIWSTIYPVGSIYMSVEDTSPATLFGGTWEQIKDTFLLASGETYEAGATGGEVEHTLTINEMPKHGHKAMYYKSDGSSPMGGYVYQTPGELSSSSNIESSFIEHTGGSLPHNNMPPYLAVYVWKRVA